MKSQYQFISSLSDYGIKSLGAIKKFEICITNYRLKNL